MSAQITRERGEEFQNSSASSSEAKGGWLTKRAALSISPAMDSPSSAVAGPTPVSAPVREGRASRLSPRELVLLAVVSGLAVAASHLGWWSIPATEAWGFATGGICVWLVVRENHWNWPVGMANNVVFFVLFWRSRLYADMGLQVVYFALSVFGWANWLYGGERRTILKVSRTTPTEWFALAACVPLGTWALQQILLRVNGAAPLWDALTTVLSLAAQYLLSRKRLENWLFWIVADVIYVPLYLSRELPLTAVLYAGFLGLCVVGWRGWWRSWKGRG